MTRRLVSPAMTGMSGISGIASGFANAEAAAYFSAAGITDATQQAAYDAFVTSLKSYGIYNKTFAIYPFLGGTAASHKWNAINPLDTDAAFRLTYTGGVTHASTGVTTNGTTGFADTKFVPTTSGFTSTSGSFGVYIRTNATGGYDFASSILGGSQSTAVLSRYGAGLQYASYGGNFGTVTTGDSRGFSCTNRNGAANTEGYSNGTQVISSSQAVSLPGFSLYIGAENRGGSAIEFSAREYAFAYISQGLTAAQQADLWDALKVYLAALSRATLEKGLWRGWSGTYSDAGTTPATVDGTAVYRIGGLSVPSGFHLDQTTLGLRPLLKTAQTPSGRNVVRYDGVDDYSVCTMDGTKLSRFVIGITLKPLDTSALKGVFAWQNALSSGTPFVLVQRNSTDIRFYVDAGYRWTIPHSTSDFKNYVLSYSGGTWNLLVNGVAQTPYVGGLTSQANAAEVYLGNGFNGYANVDIAELSVNDYSRSASELAAAMMTNAGL